MQKKDNIYITYNHFSKLLDKSKEMSCQEIIEIHKSLIGKEDSSKIHEGEFGIYYIQRLLDYSYGYSIPKEIPDQFIEFFNSKYFSDYLKRIISDSQLVKPDNISDIINSDKFLADFSEEELLAIHKFLKENGYYNLIINLAFNLNSEEAIKFLNNKIDPITVISRIIATSGLSIRPEYYSGRGARLGDLNGTHLNRIFEQLSKLDHEKALNMAKMTFNMKTLGATEFLESLYMLASNNYSLVGIEPSENNINLGSGTEEQKELIALASFMSHLSYNTDATEEIKTQFASLLPDSILNQISSCSQGIARLRK